MGAPLQITRLGTFSVFEMRKTILCLAWLAREYLSDAENAEKSSFALRAAWCSEAAAMLDTAAMMLRREGSTRVEEHLASKVTTVAAAAKLAERSRAAALAAVQNGFIARSYNDREGATVTAGPLSLNQHWTAERSTKSISIFKRAAETARQETHRLIVELCELYPDVMPTED